MVMVIEGKLHNTYERGLLGKVPQYEIKLFNSFFILCKVTK